MHLKVTTVALLALCNLAYIHNIDAHRILGLFPVPIRSHYNFYETLLLELVQRGHHVDVVTHFLTANNPGSFKQLSLAGSIPPLENNVSIADHDYQTFLHVAYEFISLGNQACEAALNHPVIDALKKATVKYDLIITEMFATDCLLPFAHIYNVPIVGISSVGMMPWADERMGNPDNPAYIPNYFHSQRGKLGFWQKLYSLLLNLGSKTWYYLLSIMPAEINGRKVFGDMPTIESIAKNTIIFLANRHFSLDDPRPLVPGVIEVGGMHIRTPGRIEPPRLLDFVKNAPHGVIYFSMGSLINMSTFSKSTMQELMKVFATLDQHIVMKLNPSDLDGIRPPSNVYISSFLPQLDILCHPNTKLFMTHGGTLSIQEAAYCGVPIIGTPFYPHQEVNVQNYEEKGAGVHLPYLLMSETTLKATIQEVLTNATFARHAKKLSDLFKDRPKKPLETAVYWSEYALKHGGRHIRSASADIIIFEYLMIDIVIVGVALAFLGFVIFYFVLQFLQELFDRPVPPKDGGEFRKEKKKNE